MVEQIQAESPPAPPEALQQWRPILALVTGVLAVSTAAIFVRLAQSADAPSLVIAALRLVVATAVLTPIVVSRYQHELRQLTRNDLKWVAVSGVVLAMHFATWITSLEYTAVVNSVTIVTTAPLWVAVMSPLFLKEKLGRWAIVGLGLALSGGILVGLSGEVGKPPTRHDPVLGNTLAAIGALMAGLYFMIGRRMRARLSVVVYIWLVYGVAAVILLGVVMVSGDSIIDLSAEAVLWIALTGLVPQLIGHSSFNYALGYFPAAFVSLVVLAEPIGSGLLAIVFLNEWPVVVQVLGSALILFGIFVASQEQQAAN